MIEIKKDINNNYSFCLKSKSGTILLNSVDFPNKKTVEKTVSKLNPTLSSNKYFERKTNHNGKFLFALKDNEGNVVGKSQLYNSEAGMENGIKNIKNSLSSVPNWNQL